MYKNDGVGELLHDSLRNFKEQTKRNAKYIFLPSFSLSLPSVSLSLLSFSLSLVFLCSLFVVFGRETNAPLRGDLATPDILYNTIRYDCINGVQIFIKCTKK